MPKNIKIPKGYIRISLRHKPKKNDAFFYKGEKPIELIPVVAGLGFKSYSQAFYTNRIVLIRPIDPNRSVYP